VLSVAIAQVTGRPFAPDENLQLCERAILDAVARSARLVVLPELIVPGYLLERDSLNAAAEPLDGPTLASWSRLARSHSLFIAGGFAERDGDRLFNTAILVGPEGLLIHYRKLHLFDLEKQLFTPGDLGLPLVRTDAGTMGLCVCYDLRFVEVVRALALRGADIILVPTAWVAGFDKQRWDAEGYCPQARGAMLQANLSQVFIVCASQAGSNGAGDFLGSSIIADPYGKSLAAPLPGRADEIAVIEIDLNDAARARERAPLIRPRDDRRRDVYGIAIAGEVL
jgi:predicted amidohydrolase